MSAIETPRDTELAILTAEIRACRICRDTPSGTVLPHEPRPVLRVSSTARICLCGQAPGSRVHASGLPFTDPSGDRLRDWMGVSTSEFYDTSRVAIVPMGFCFPGLDAKGGDLPPRTECAPAWREALFQALPTFELIVLIGQYAHRWHLKGRAKESLTATVGNWRSYVQGAGPCLLPLPHPSWRNNAWLKRNPWFEAEVLPYLRKEIRRLLLFS
ncbi:MAG: uracil-DNA glycosylase family protein [Alphaproteobacteria bacterium]